jgi:hypothetical protein
MNTILLHLAAVELDLAPLSIEPDGTMWTGLETERTDLTTAQVTAITKRATELEAEQKSAKQAVLDRLGITADEARMLLS